MRFPCVARETRRGAHRAASAPSGMGPGMATQVLAGKAVRRLKALCETGEIPNTDFNPSARDDAGERSPA